jgi:hypothetical protein
VLLVIGSGREDRGGRGPFEAGHECVDLVHWQLHVACHATHQLDVTHTASNFSSSTLLRTHQG